MNLVQDKFVQIPEKESFLGENGGEFLCFERAGNGGRAERMNALQKSPTVDHPCQAVHPSGGQDALRTQGEPSLFSEMQCISQQEGRAQHTCRKARAQVSPPSGLCERVDDWGPHPVQRLRGRDRGPGSAREASPGGRGTGLRRPGRAVGGGASPRICVLTLQPGV